MRKILLIMFVVGHTALTAQTPMNLDSLLRLLPGAKEDTSKALLFIHIGQQYEGTNLDSAAYYYLQCKSLSNKLDYTKGKIKFITNFTFVLNQKSLLDSSLRLNLESVALALTYGDRRTLAACLSNVGSSYFYLNRLDSAAKYYLEALEIATALQDEVLLMQTTQHLGLIYSDLKQYEKAIAMLDKTVVAARAQNNPVFLSVALLNQGMVFNYLRQFDKAILALDESQRIAEVAGDDFTQAHALLNLGHQYLATSQFKKPKANFLKALSISRKMQLKELAAITLRSLGTYYFFQEQTDSAFYYAHQSLRLCLELKLLDETGKGYKLLSDVAQQTRDYKDMNMYSNKADSVENLIQLEAVAGRIAELNTKYESEIKENQIELQKAAIR